MRKDRQAQPVAVISFWFDTSLKKLLQKRAARQQRSVSALIRRLVLRELAASSCASRSWR